MKNKLARMILMAGTLILGFLPVCRAQDAISLRFDDAEWDFGTVREEDGRVTHAFGFVNAGRVPAVIERVEVTCGCTVPTFSHDPVKSGGRGVVNVSFDPAGYAGKFFKSVMVFSGGQKYFLTLTGDVTPRQKSVEELYPWKMGEALRFDKITAMFRQVAHGTVASMVIKYANTSERSVSLAFGRAESGLLDIHAPESICAGCRGEITLTYDLTGNDARYGVITDKVAVEVDGKASENAVSASIIGVDNFSDIRVDDSPRAVLSSVFCDFGAVVKRFVPHTRRIVLRNDGSQTLVVRDVGESPGLKTTLRNGMTVAPGAELHFELLLYSDKFSSGDLAESIVLIFNDPLRPVRELRAAAKIK